MEEDTKQLEERLAGAFHLMYDNFPEGVQLTHKSRRIVALNDRLSARGRSVGMLCVKQGGEAAHKGCLANKALASGRTVWVRKPGPKGDVTVFWIPVEGHPDYYVHFAVGMETDYSQSPQPPMASGE
ncbi:MAG: hypothetical protein LBP95_06835 [Deltaproteobacteria bacterium]|jgi:hypothetical protein|nr:hypothetical protein [Deltaproteobacteria bacterium]